MQAQEEEEGVTSHLTYRIDVATGREFGAGTDANVFCTLTGERLNSSGEFQLANSLTRAANKFERGQVSQIGVFFTSNMPMECCCRWTRSSIEVRLLVKFRK